MDSRQKSLTPEEFLPILEEEPEDGGYLEDDRSDEEEHEENHDHLVNQEIYSDENNDHNYNPQNQDTNEQVVEGPLRRLDCQERVRIMHHLFDSVRSINPSLVSHNYSLSSKDSCFGNAVFMGIVNI